MNHVVDIRIAQMFYMVAINAAAGVAVRF